MIEIVEPAPFLETRALFTAGPIVKPGFGAMATRHAAARTVGFLADGRLLATIGFWPLGEGAEEVFVVAAPRAQTAPHLVALVRAARLTLAARRQDGVGRFVAYVLRGHEPGRRLARLAGFRLITCEAAAAFERWERAA